MILEVGLLLFLILVLYKSSEVLVESARIISAYFDIPEFFIGFLFIAFGTSLPELAVSVASSYFGHVDIAYGTVVGSNILDIALVLGLIILLNRRIRIESDLLLRDMVFTILISLIPLFLLFFNLPHFILGSVLLSLFFLYLFKVMKEKRFKREIEVSAREAVKASLLIFPMLFLVIVTSFLIPNLVEQVAMDLKIDDLLIAMTFVALGTSLPELMAGMSAERKGYDYILWGDLTGSLVINATLVFGLSMLFSPF
ncbi:MAG TPA: sodium:calcium antiporter, partial [Candidatus Aenigmarchaeota archaeon]|nr:sodium:calcium antiporter [Candidatus Aenigmarchaeota archaeon]